MKYSVLLAGASVAALCASGADAKHQETGQTSATEVIQVTGSRVARTGFDAPTPTTVLGADDFERVAAPNLADVINQLPAARPSLTPSSSTNNTGVAGGNFLDLRGLGANRTLVLVDGKRFVPTQLTGGINVNVIPQALVNNVDVVTGGASAAWGSDAVAGVVNFRFDRQFEGVRGVTQAGVSDHGDRRTALVSLAYGANFDDGRGSFQIAGESAHNSGIDGQGRRGWGRQGWGLIANPAYTADNNEPRRLLVRNVRSANTSLGGVINSGPLRGIQFDPNGDPVPFRYGDLATASTMVGGDGASNAENLVVEVPVDRHSVYGRASYAFSPAFTGYVEASYSFQSSDHASLTNSDRSLTIRRDNAFLPESIRQAMFDEGIETFSMGRLNLDYARVQNEIETDAARFVVGAEGEFGQGWSWDAYYTYGESETRTVQANNRITANFQLAADAVLDPATGSIVCRSTLSDPANGCVPANLFGQGNVSEQAQAYMNGASERTANLNQHAAAFTLRGEPLSTWAGPVSLATGVEFRREEAAIVADSISENFGFFTGNTVPWDGGVEVKEGFAEVVIPLAENQSWARSLDLNMAARYTHYSTSGGVTTWKIGPVYEINDSVRLRATRSRDIRAPSLSELFNGASSAYFTVFDPEAGQNVSVMSISSGNPDLAPEVADTWTVGAVLSPSFAPGLRVSLDYFNISLDDAIISLSAAATVDRCYTVQPQLCGQLIRENGELTQVLASPQNLQSLTTSGFDLEVSYGTALDAVFAGVPGDLTLRALVTYVDELSLDDGVVANELAGSTVQPTILAVGGVPHWRANLTATYEVDRYRASATVRHVGGGNINNDFTSKDLNVLEHDGRTYLDLSVRARLVETARGDAELFAAVNNALDSDPPVTGTGGFVTVRSLYDTVGRYYTAGVRFRF